MEKAIIYYASNDSMGDDMIDQDCADYRSWAESEITSRYPDHDVSVSAKTSHETVYTDDYEREDEINLFCSELWNRYGKK